MTTIVATPNLIALAHALADGPTDPPSAWSHLPVRDAQVGDLYRYVPEKGTPRTGTIVSIGYPVNARKDKTQLVFGVSGILKDSRGKDKIHFIRHDVIGTFYGQFKITNPEGE